MFFEELTDDEWARLAPLAADEPVHPHRRGRPRAEPRVVTNAVLWILTTGERWSKLPARYPSGPTCRRRFDDWLADGTLTKIVSILSEFGRTFAYVPQPDTTVHTTTKAAPLPTPESPRLRGVFWTNPESWHAASEVIDSASHVDAAETNGANGACTSTARRDLPAASSRCAPMPGAMPRLGSERSNDLPLVASVAVTKRSEEYRGYDVRASAQPVAKQLQLTYRASAEILKDGRRVERSGLIGPRFPDGETAEQYALAWARDWIDRHEAAAQARRETAESALVALPDTRQGADEPQAAASTPALAAVSASAQSTRVLDPGIIRSRTPEWILHSHADGRGDTKPPEVLYHA